MSSNAQEPIFGNDADIIILKASDGVTDTTRRPASEANRKRAQEYREKVARYRQLMEQSGNAEPDENPTVLSPEAKLTDPDPGAKPIDSDPN